MGNNKIIVLGLSPTAKYVGKEAYLLKIKCKAFDFKKGSAYYSKYFEETQVLATEQVLQKFKNEYLGTSTQYFVCPTSDEWVEFLNHNKEIFTGTNLHTSYSILDGSFMQLADKFQLMKLANALALNYPKSIRYVPGRDNHPDLANFDFPVFIKPSNRSGLAHIMKGKKGWLLHSKGDWENLSILQELTNIELLIQEVVVGQESNIKVLGTVAKKGIRNQPG